MAANFLEDAKGNKSSTRLILVFVALTALALVYIQAFTVRILKFDESTIKLIEVLLVFGTCHQAIQKWLDNRAGPAMPEDKSITNATESK